MIGGGGNRVIFREQDLCLFKETVQPMADLVNFAKAVHREAGLNPAQWGCTTLESASSGIKQLTQFDHPDGALLVLDILDIDVLRHLLFRVNVGDLLSPLQKKERQLAITAKAYDALGAFGEISKNVFGTTLAPSTIAKIGGENLFLLNHIMTCTRREQRGDLCVYKLGALAPAVR